MTDNDKDLWGNAVGVPSNESVERTDYPETVYDMAFSFDESITPIEKIALFHRYGSAKAILSLSCGTIKNILGRGWSGTKFDALSFIERAAKMQDFIKNSNIKVLRFDDEKYPLGLKQIPDCPYLLYYKGNLDYNYETALGCVGTRKPSPEGEEAARRYSDYFAANGLTVVSGLALGIDSICHKSACDHGRQTIAVMGCGIDRIYPAANKDLARSILDNGGAIVSEYPPGVTGAKWRFPRRNRIIVGLSRGIFVAQSPNSSGSLITAFLAADYSRDLFVACGSDGEDFAGNRMLADKGATCLHSPEEIFDDWKF